MVRAGNSSKSDRDLVNLTTHRMGYSLPPQVATGADASDLVVAGSKLSAVSFCHFLERCLPSQRWSGALNILTGSTLPCPKQKRAGQGGSASTL